MFHATLKKQGLQGLQGLQQAVSPRLKSRRDAQEGVLEERLEPLAPRALKVFLPLLFLLIRTQRDSSNDLMSSLRHQILRLE